jgi:putative endonuclease
MNDIYVVYILQSDNYSYVGMTNNFLNRIRQHNKEIKGGAKYTSSRENWYPICIIDGFPSMKEACQCEWSLKHYMKKKYKGPKGRINRLSALLTRGIWTSKSPLISEQNLTIYIDDEYKHLLICEDKEVKELYWRL